MQILVQLSSRFRALPLSFHVGLWLTITVSMTFQALLVGEFGSDASVTPDGTGYLKLAQELQAWGHREAHAVGDYIRTPGYPLVILGASVFGSVNELKECEIPIGDWSNTNPQGRRLVKHVILMQQLMGLLIPIVLYLLAHDLTRWPSLAFLSSLVFAYDISAVCYQFVVLTEAASMAAIVVVLALVARVLRRPSGIHALMLGLAVSWATIVRPAFLILAPMLLALLVVHGWTRRQNFRTPILLFSIAAASLPVLWAFSNLSALGHFFFTKNQTVTLENFTSRHFVEMEVENPELRIFQKNVRVALEKSPMFPMSNSMWQTAEELDEDDIYEMYRLADLANRMTLAANMGPFMQGAWMRFRSMFSEGFRDVKNRYVQLRLEHLTGNQSGSFRDTKLLFGPASGLLLVLFCVAALFAVPDHVLREFLIFSVLFALAFMFLSGAFDENEHIRHAMAARIVINFVLVLSGGLILRKACSSIAGLGTGRRAGMAGPAPGTDRSSI